MALMQVLLHILLGLAIIGGGVLSLKNNYQVANTMPIGFAEQHLGAGGSYTAWKFLSILIIFIGLTVLLGIYDNILGWLLSPLTNAISGGSN